MKLLFVHFAVAVGYFQFYSIALRAAKGVCFVTNNCKAVTRDA